MRLPPVKSAEEARQRYYYGRIRYYRAGGLSAIDAEYRASNEADRWLASQQACINEYIHLRPKRRRHANRRV